MGIETVKIALEGLHETHERDNGTIEIQGNDKMSIDNYS